MMSLAELITGGIPLLFRTIGRVFDWWINLGWVWAILVFIVLFWFFWIIFFAGIDYLKEY